MLKKDEERSQHTLLSHGLKVFAVLHMPKVRVGEKVPAVLFCHGFGGNKSGKFRLSVRQSELLSNLGIASLRLDFRGSGDSEGDFKDTTIGTQLDDARVGLQFLLQLPQIDVTRIGLLGRSLGGCIATHLAAEFTPLKALCLWVPVFDAVPWLAQYKGTDAAPRFFGEKLSEECIAEFQELTASQPLAKLASVPLFLVRAGLDEVLGEYHHNKYLECRKNADSLVLPQSNHEFANFEEQQTLLKATASWFSKSL